MDETLPATPDPRRPLPHSPPSSDPTLIARAPTPESEETVDGSSRAASRPAADTDRDFGRYRLLVELGRGGMGIVWKAWDEELQRLVALKVIRSQEDVDEAQIQRFLREARLAAKLSHPHIVGVLDVGEHRGRRYFTSEFIQGRSLDVRMKAGLPVKTAVAWMKAVAEALAYAHEHGVVHRDMKPGNILIDEKDHPFVMDFGLAKEVATADSQGSAPLTMTGAILGTPQYMSPEQATGRGEDVGTASDQFSLGSVLYELIAGLPPFMGSGFRELLNAIIEQDPTPPSRLEPKVHRDLETICLKALEKDPAQRYESLSAMAEDLGRYLDGEPIAARPVSTVERLVRSAKRHRAVVIPVAAIALVAIAIGGWAVRSSMQTTREAHLREEESARAGRAEEALAKSAAVSAVFGRWTLVAPVLDAMESTQHDARASAEDRLARGQALRRELERFRRETPADGASQAAMEGLTGWAKWIAGDREEALARFARASEADPDVPFGALFEATAQFDDLGRGMPLPRVEVDALGLRFAAAAAEPPGLVGVRQRIEVLVDQARKARVWGREGADALARLLSGVQAMSGGEWGKAEEDITVALGAPDLRAFRTRLRFARAVARYMQKRFDGALEDLEEVRRAWPLDSGCLYDLAEVRFGAALERQASGGDPVPLVEASIAGYEAALAASSNLTVVYLISLANALVWRGRFEAERGGDGRPWLERGVRVADEALAQDPHATWAFCARALASVGLGTADSEARAKADFSAALAIDPECVPALAGLASARKALARRAEAAGGDPRTEYVASVEAWGEAARIEPQNPVYLHNRASVRRRLGGALAARGIDPTEAYLEGLEDEKAALALRPGIGFVLNEEGLLLRDLGMWRENSGEEVRDAYEEALAAFVLAMDAAPLEWEAAANRGRLLAMLGRLEEAVASYDEALRRFPGASAVRALRDEALRQLGK